MYLITHIDGVVIATSLIPDEVSEVSAENVALVSEVPEFEPKKGCVGRLMYDGSNLYWGYEEIENGVSAEEFVSMLEEVL